MPRYQSEEDLRNEKEVVEVMRANWQFGTHYKLPERYVLDHMLMKGGLWRFAEIKCRNWEFGAGNGFMIALNKLTAAHQLRCVCGVLTRLVVRFKDGKCRWAPLTTPIDRDMVQWGGRSDRPTDLDAYEPCMMIPWGWFQEMKEGTDEQRAA